MFRIMQLVALSLCERNELSAGCWLQIEFGVSTRQMRYGGLLAAHIELSSGRGHSGRSKGAEARLERSAGN